MYSSCHVRILCTKNQLYVIKIIVQMLCENCSKNNACHFIEKFTNSDKDANNKSELANIC